MRSFPGHVAATLLLGAMMQSALVVGPVQAQESATLDGLWITGDEERPVKGILQVSGSTLTWESVGLGPDGPPPEVDRFVRVDERHYRFVAAEEERSLRGDLFWVSPDEVRRVPPDDGHTNAWAWRRVTGRTLPPELLGTWEALFLGASRTDVLVIEPNRVVLDPGEERELVFDVYLLAPAEEGFIDVALTTDYAGILARFHRIPLDRTLIVDWIFEWGDARTVVLYPPGAPPAWLQPPTPRAETPGDASSGAAD